MAPDPQQILDDLAKRLDRAEKFRIHPLLLGRIQGFVAGVALTVAALMLGHLFGV